jgi:hypothetical protein
VTNQKEQEKEIPSNKTNKGETVNSRSSKKKKDRNKKKRIKVIVYYNRDTSSSSPREDNDSSFTKKRWSNKTIPRPLLIILVFLTIPILIYCLFLLANPLTLMGKIIHGGVIKCGIIYFLFILAFGMLLRMECSDR